MNETLRKIQLELNAPKDKYNSYGKYAYRSAEGILEALKPLLAKHKADLTITDSIVYMEGRWYLKATVVFESTEGQVVVNGWARESETKKGMDESQITGTASSYARKYALNGLFLIDDTKDADTDEYHKQTERKAQNYEDYAPADDSPMVGEQQVKLLTSLAEEKDVPLDAVCDRFGVNSISELTKKEFVMATKMLEATKVRK